jgi:hypothetical protein
LQIAQIVVVVKKQTNKQKKERDENRNKTNTHWVKTQSAHQALTLLNGKGDVSEAVAG